MTTATAHRIDHKHGGYSIRFEGGAWYGYEWERLTCLAISSTCITEPMTEAEAEAWIASF